jgi:small subunit ribosomal protein S9
MFDDDVPEDEQTTPEEETPEVAAEETPAEAPETPAAEEATAAEAEESAEEAEAPAEEAEAPAEEPQAEEAPAEGEDAPAEGEEAAAEKPKSKPKKKKKDDADKPDVIPGAHLEPDLVLDEAKSESGLGAIAAAELEAAEAALAAGADGEQAPAEEAAPAPTPILKLAADARYSATGKRKSAVARVTLKPGTGVYTINGRELDAFFPRPSLQRVARQPLETAGQQERMDVVAQIHGGGVSAQAGALRHGIARALVDADINLRGELKRRGFLTRDPRVKERKKAGLKKARKRPQFSKR